ncbi:hypothetical protein BU23DRAFT_145601 [Bimuria novae-zelandiae CBS 107.79]|uniref:Uncharacterized protein n=1 Tax=Bimuria novae-zelandiae CBS 107.79 TaxID=1447943 RepID=A0A6A5VA77_9PLEO|nr:hypothetical protein BU23DRAFT_145601 [Bimuria novae-zelandiae CBS 107.79]
MRFPHAVTLLVLALSTAVLALQGQKPKQPPSTSFCGWTKYAPNNTVPDCAQNLHTSPCLVDNGTCAQMPGRNQSGFLSVLKECSCEFYQISSCTGLTLQEYHGQAVRDSLMGGPLAYYKCKRNDGGRMFEVGMVSLIGGAMLAMVAVGL